MAFLRNDGDIIVDAVLTDVGRELLAKGQPIVAQFAVGDEEIDYGLFNASNTSGSAYYDIDIMNTPIFEPSTYSQAAMGSRLFSYSDNTLQYLPVLKLNQVDTDATNLASDTLAINVIASDAMSLALGDASGLRSVIDGRRNIPINTNPAVNSRNAGTKRYIAVDQGFDTAAAVQSLGDLEETSFSVYVNSLFLRVVNQDYEWQVPPAVITNTFSRTQSTDVYRLFFSHNERGDKGLVRYFGDVAKQPSSNGTYTLQTSLANTSQLDQVGKQLRFSLQLADRIANAPADFFNAYGQSFSGLVNGVYVSSAKVITTYVRVVGDNYGFATDIPVKLFYV